MLKIKILIILENFNYIIIFFIAEFIIEILIISYIIDYINTNCNFIFIFE